MMIVGCDYHPAFQQIAFVDTDTGELHASRSRRVGRLLSAFSARNSTVLPPQTVVFGEGKDTQPTF